MSFEFILNIAKQQIVFKQSHSGYAELDVLVDGKRNTNREPVWVNNEQIEFLTQAYLNSDVRDIVRYVVKFDKFDNALLNTGLLSSAVQAASFSPPREIMQLHFQIKNIISLQEKKDSDSQLELKKIPCLVKDIIKIIVEKKIKDDVAKVIVKNLIKTFVEVAEFCRVVQNGQHHEKIIEILLASIPDIPVKFRIYEIPVIHYANLHDFLNKLQSELSKLDFQIVDNKQAIGFVAGRIGDPAIIKNLVPRLSLKEKNDLFFVVTQILKLRRELKSLPEIKSYLDCVMILIENGADIYLQYSASKTDLCIKNIFEKCFDLAGRDEKETEIARPFLNNCFEHLLKKNDPDKLWFLIIGIFATYWNSSAMRKEVGVPKLAEMTFILMETLLENSRFRGFLLMTVLESVIKNNHFADFFQPWIDKINMNGLSRVMLIEIFKLALQQGQQGHLMSACLNEDPELLNYRLLGYYNFYRENAIYPGSPKQHLSNFMLALNNKYYPLAAEMLASFTFEIETILPELFKVDNANNAHHFFPHIVPILSQLIRRGETIFIPKHIRYLVQLVEHGLMSDIEFMFNKDRAKNQVLLENHLMLHLYLGDEALKNNALFLFRSLKARDYFAKELIEYCDEFAELDMKSDAVAMRFCQAFEKNHHLAYVLKHNARVIFSNMALSALIKFYNMIFSSSYYRKLIADLASLHFIALYDSGYTEEKWWEYLACLIDRAPEPRQFILENKADTSSLDAKDKPQPIKKMKPLQEKIAQAMSLDFKIGKSEFKTETMTFLKLQGRTLRFKKDDGKIYSIKVRKKEEDPQVLVKEYIFERALNEAKNELKLQSHVPTAIEVTKMHGITTWLQGKVSQEELAQFKKMVADDKEQVVYVYECEPDYLTYLHEVKSDEEFNKVNELAIEDICTLLSQGIIFDQLVDIFHNTSADMKLRSDKGIFIILANILAEQSFHNPYSQRIFRSYDPSGTGRLDGGINGATYPNIRRSGLSDWGDTIYVQNRIDPDDSETRLKFGIARDCYGKKIGNYLLANDLAKVQYSLFLMGARRAVELLEEAKKEKRDTVYIDNIWKNLANQVVNNCALMIEKLTSQDRKKMRHWLTDFIDMDRLAKQMQFWITDEYISPFKSNTLPSGLYEKGAVIDLNFSKIRMDTFGELGFSINKKNRDFGPVNGPEPMTELNKLLYWMDTIIYTEYFNTQLSLTGYQKAKKHYAEAKSQPQREMQSYFPHLTDAQYHKQRWMHCSLQDAKNQSQAIKHKEKYLRHEGIQRWKSRLFSARNKPKNVNSQHESKSVLKRS